MTDEHKKKISIALKKRALLFPSMFKGQVITEERRKRISDTLKKKAHLLPNTFKKGRIPKPEHVEKMRLSKRSVPWSEARRKAQEARKGKRYNFPRSSKGVIKNGKVYSFDWHELRKLIYKRDDWICQECGIKCHNTSRQRIQCHHIDYDEQNNDPSNLITLCAVCHGKTNFKRSDWINHFITRRVSQ
jgi:hypothetical protein